MMQHVQMTYSYPPDLTKTVTEFENEHWYEEHNVFEKKKLIDPAGDNEKKDLEIWNPMHGYLKPKAKVFETLGKVHFEIQLENLSQVKFRLQFQWGTMP